MERLIITTEYKFMKGGAIFYSQLGQKIKVKLDNNIVIEGELISVNTINGEFILGTNKGNKKIYCNEVVDIMPM